MYKRMLLCLLLLSLSLSSFAAGLCEKPLRAVRHHDSPLDSDDAYLIALLQKAGCELQIIRSSHRVTLLRRLEMLREGEIDVVIGLSKFPDREAYAHFSIPYREENVRMLVRADDKAMTENKTTQQLLDEGWQLIGPIHGWFGPLLEAQRQQPDKIIEYKTLAQAIRLLQGKRGDIILTEEAWLSTVPAAKLAELYVLPELIHRASVYILYAKKTVPASLVVELDKLIANGSKYNGSLPAR